MSLLAGYLLRDKTNTLVNLENRIDIQQVHTVEGNSGDSCRVNQYRVGYYEILGYGVPSY